MTRKRKLSPAERALEHQRSELRRSMHDWVDQVCDAWPAIDEQARTMGAGFPTSDLGGERGGGEDDGRTAALAVAHLEAPRFDPAIAAADWEAHRIETVAHLRVLAGEAVRLRPLTKSQVDRARTEGEMQVCTGCKLPAPSGRDAAGFPTLAIDKYGRPWHPEHMPTEVDRCSECGLLASETELVGGKPVHARELGSGCYFRAYNRARGRRPSKSERRAEGE